MDGFWHVLILLLLSWNFAAYPIFDRCFTLYKSPISNPVDLTRILGICWSMLVTIPILSVLNPNFVACPIFLCPVTVFNHIIHIKHDHNVNDISIFSGFMAQNSQGNWSREHLHTPTGLTIILRMFLLPPPWLDQNLMVYHRFTPWNLPHNGVKTP